MVRRFLGGFAVLVATVVFAVLCGIGILVGLFTGAEEAMVVGATGVPNPLRKRLSGDGKLHKTIPLQRARASSKSGNGFPVPKRDTSGA